MATCDVLLDPLAERCPVRSVFQRSASTHTAWYTWTEFRRVSTILYTCGARGDAGLLGDQSRVFARIRDIDDDLFYLKTLGDCLCCSML